MSHFRVGVLLKDDEDLDEIMYPYDETTEDERYLEDMIECDKIKYLECYVYPNIFYDLFEPIIEHQPITDDGLFCLSLLDLNEIGKIECFAHKYNHRLDENRNKLCRCNPNAKYDYYSDYGVSNWFNLSTLLTKNHYVKTNWNTFEAVYLKDIPKDKWLLNRPWAIVTSEEWIEPGQVGWFASDNSTEESRKKYEEKYNNILTDENYKDYCIVILDLHI